MREIVELMGKQSRLGMRIWRGLLKRHEDRLVINKSLVITNTAVVTIRRRGVQTTCH